MHIRKYYIRTSTNSFIVIIAEEWIQSKILNTTKSLKTQIENIAHKITKKATSSKKTLDLMTKITCAKKQSLIKLKVRFIFQRFHNRITLKQEQGLTIWSHNNNFNLLAFGPWNTIAHVRILKAGPLYSIRCKTIYTHVVRYKRSQSVNNS